MKAARSTAPLSGGPGPQTGAAKLTVSFYIHSGVRSQRDCTSDPPGTGAGRLRPRPHIREFTPWGHGILIGLYCSPRDWCETIGIPSAVHQRGTTSPSPAGLRELIWILIGLYCSPSGLVRNDWNPGILIELYFSPRDWCETIGIPSARYNLSQPCVAKGIKIQLKELPGLRAEDTIAYRHHQSL